MKPSRTRVERATWSAAPPGEAVPPPVDGQGRPAAMGVAAGRPRTWAVELPAGMGRHLNANRRHHYMARARLVREMKDCAIWCVRAAKVPHLERAHIVAEYRPPDRRRRDVHNLYPAVKAAIDGAVAAGVLTDDSDAYLLGPDMRVSDQLVLGGQFVLHVTELPAVD